jgi:hypothetical protein
MVMNISKGVRQNGQKSEFKGIESPVKMIKFLEYCRKELLWTKKLYVN